MPSDAAKEFHIDVPNEYVNKNVINITGLLVGSDGCDVIGEPLSTQLMNDTVFCDFVTFIRLCPVVIVLA